MNSLHFNVARLQRSLLLVCLLLLAASLHAQTLVWEDNFNGTSLNTNMWSYDFGNGCNRGICGWGNAELEYYTSRPENVSVQNGTLIIEGRRESFGGNAFTSGRIKTEGRMHFKYGTLEARIKVPNLQNGLWPAFWLLGDSGGWPANGEIDIMEMGHVNAISAGVVNRRVGGACHWDNNGYAFAGSHTDYPTNLNTDFHIYKLVWDPTNVTCYVDNAQVFTMNITSADKTEFHIPHYMILNLAIGGNYTGITTASGITAPLPARMEIDYVRLYQNAGSTLYLGSNNAITGTYGIYTETTPVTGSVTYGADANLYLWNGLTPVGTTAFEGSQVMSYNVTAGQWWGLGVATSYKNLSAFQPTGQLRFHMKTTSTETIGIGISTGHGDSWIDLVNGGNQYGLVRNGQWCAVSIPFSAFPDLDLYSVKQIFMMKGGAPAAGYSFAVDNIYYSGGGTPPNTPPTVSITAPANNASFTAPANINITANASDPGGSVTSVAFYNGSTLLGTDTSSPYSFAWNNVGTGSYSITARATDNGGLTTSAAVNITVGTTPTGNLALNRPVTVSSTENAGTPGSAAVDGNTGTRWSSAAADPQWIYVDLGQTYNVNRVRITWETALGRDYQVQIATAAGGPWTTMRSVTGNTALVNDQTGLSGSGRYVRIFGTARGTAWGYSIWELEVYGTSGNTPPTANAGADRTVTLPTNSVTINGTGSDPGGSITAYAWTRVSGPNTPTMTNANTANLTASGLIAGTYVFRLTVTDNGGLTASDDVNVVVSSAPTTNIALNKPTTVSSTETVGTPGSAAVDGNTTSRWSSAFSDPQWIYVDLGGNYNVTRVRIVWEAAYATAYQIQIASAAGGPWTTMRSVTGNTTLVNDQTGLSGTGRYVRIFGTARATGYGYSIFELEVYGTAAARMALNEDDQDASKIKSYPNPARDTYFVDGVKEGAHVLIRNATGTEMRETRIKNGAIDIHNLAPGIYLIEVRDGQRSVQQRLVVE